MAWIVVFNRIPQLMAAVEANSRSAVKANADELRDEMKRRAPVDTGELRNSIESTSVTAGKSAEVNVGAEHGIYNEYGTYKMAAQPFFHPAIEAVWPNFLKDVGRSVTF
jgi:HK97 gp10 family phage protein